MAHSNQIGISQCFGSLTRIIPLFQFCDSQENHEAMFPSFITRPLMRCISIWFIVILVISCPIFPILLLPLLIVDHASSIVALMMVGELICVWLTYKHYQTVSSEAYAKLLHYLMLPAPIIICLLGGQRRYLVCGVLLWEP